jgi:hypothetical protein
LNIREYTSLAKEKSREKCKNFGIFGIWDGKGILNDG